MVGPILIVMRLAEMQRMHPDQITAKCARCGHDVGVYPSGQKVMREHANTELVCSVCKSPGFGVTLAPGALAERGQSKRKQ